ncbi:hypothetical protein HII31_06124 [Pseudocercospora fuligena]|uniref:Uncharacterized protein n=1 Tax=Pseudocercospora fuligena TaxID=685502 RepID=A0A8H6RKI2_9PEZI|nr:hypothetical protein HII31_06124 [Pseudocercospora fuligena]
MTVLSSDMATQSYSEVQKASTSKQPSRRLKEICVLFQLKKDHYGPFRALAVHHLRKNTTVARVKEQLNDIAQRSTVKLAVGFLTAYGPALWPANSKFRPHLLKADLGIWGKRFALEAPSYVKDASMTFSARARYRKENADRDPRGDTEIAHSKLGKLMTEYFDALLHVIDDEGDEGELDDGDLLNAILGRGRGDEDGSNATDDSGSADAPHESVSRESSPEEPLSATVRRNKAQLPNACGTLAVDTTRGDIGALPSVPLDTTHQLEASNSTSRESSPDTPLVVERVHRLLAHTSMNNLTSGEDIVALSALLQQNSTTDAGLTASTPSTEQEVPSAATFLTPQASIPQPESEAIQIVEEGSAEMFNSLTHDFSNLDASPGADAEGISEQSIYDQLRAFINDGEVSANNHNQPQQPTINPALLTSTPLNTYAMTQPSTPQIGNGFQAQASEVTRPGSTTRRCVPPSAQSSVARGSGKRPSRGSFGEMPSKRRATTTMSPPPRPDRPLPPHLWTPMTAESTWRPTPEVTGDWEGMRQRLQLMKIASGGIGGLPRV